MKITFNSIAHGIFPGKNIRVGFHFLLHGIIILDPGIEFGFPALQAGSCIAGGFFTD